MRFGRLVIIALFCFAFLLAVQAASAESQVVFELRPQISEVLFKSTTCNVATDAASGSKCPKEFGWEGNTVYYKFFIPNEINLTPKLKIHLDVPYEGWNSPTKVLLEIRAGSSNSVPTVVSSGTTITIGGFDFEINSSIFRKGQYNYIRFYGTNIKPIGYGTNPPNFQVGYLSLATIDPFVPLTDEQLLDKTEAQAARYFYEQALPNGLVKDAANSGFSSIAATGFGLAAFPVMAQRFGSNADWVYSPSQLRARANQILDTMLAIKSGQAGNPNSFGKEGLFYHFINASNTRQGSSEVSTIDSALLFAGAITAGEYFGGEVKQKADLLTSNVNWQFYFNNSKMQFSHGWTPEAGLFAQTWDRPSDETMLVSLMALASSPNNRGFQKSFYSWPRVSKNYAGFNVVNSYFGSLFTYQYAHAFFDFEQLDADIPSKAGASVQAVDWWVNSQNACFANRQFVIDNKTIYSSYWENSWGLSAVQKPNGSYEGSYGAKPCEANGGNPLHDGTIAVYASIACMPFMGIPEIPPGQPQGRIKRSLSDNEGFLTLKNYYNNFYSKLWGPYGPFDSFNTSSFSSNYLGIDEGIIVLMIENFRSGLIWDNFKKNSKIVSAEAKIFFNCSSNSECNDNNPATIDYCQYPGTKQSKCVFERTIKNAFVIGLDDCGLVQKETCPQGMAQKGSIHIGEECIGGIRASSFTMASIKSGWLGFCSANNESVLVLGLDDCTGKSKACPTGYSSKGSIHIGKCDGAKRIYDYQGTSTAAGWAVICTKNTAATSIAYNDCTKQTGTCPTGYNNRGSIHQGTCDGAIELSDYLGNNADAGWLGLCSKDN